MSRTKQEQTEKLLAELKSSIAEECSKHKFGEYDHRLDGLSEEEQKRILEESFAAVYLYNGDDELISSCNDEYHLNDIDAVVSNGCVNLSVMLNDRDKRAGKLGDSAKFEYITSLRGGSYIIIETLGYKSAELCIKYNLYANRNVLEKDYRCIMESLNLIKSYRHLIDDYIQKNGIHIMFDGAYARGYV